MEVLLTIQRFHPSRIDHIRFNALAPALDYIKMVISEEENTTIVKAGYWAVYRALKADRSCLVATSMYCRYTLFFEEGRKESVVKG
ncbi:MAG: hypothetical protein JNK10_09025 [Cyclobacteriaceae bacterium]|nr:hypothetical protein [Cyclobacteriaceae bacterium]